MSKDLEALIAFSRAATPGKWLALDTISHDWIIGIPSGHGYIGIARVFHGAQTKEEQARANAAFIAAASPSVVEDIATRLMKAERIVGKFRKWYDNDHHDGFSISRSDMGILLEVHPPLTQGE